MGMSRKIFVAPSETRLCCVAAHVDHGKTSLCDNLIESNGLISERLAGTLRYLDSDPEEQRRGITIRSSAIGLQHSYTTKQSQRDMIIHLLDSPGHTDFSMEVSSALTACDSALLVIDAVEGLGPRTHQVFREAFLNRLIPILVINKIDRLCTELELSPTEAYIRLRSLLEAVNAAAYGIVTSAMEQPDEDMEQRWNFDAAKGNVIFCSALFGWGFTSASLAKALFRSKIVPFKPIVLRQCIFSDTKFKDGKLLKWKQTSVDDAPLFAEYGLQPIWDIYQGIVSAESAVKVMSRAEAKLNASSAGMETVIAALQIGFTGKDDLSNTEQVQRVLTKTGSSSSDSMLRCLLRRFRPLADSVLDTICEYAPSPELASRHLRTDVLGLVEPSIVPENFAEIRNAVRICDAGEIAPVVAYVSKFMATDTAHIRDPELPLGQKTTILGLARVLSGVLRTGEEYFVIKSKDTQPSKTRRKIRVYLLMGSSFVNVDEVPAGHLCAVYGLEDMQVKTLTLSSSESCTSVVGLEQRVRPLVKVNIEPMDTKDADALERGLMKLCLADSAVEVTATARGERILACLGEIHLEQSLLDLKNHYFDNDIPLRISDPLVDFGETTDWFEQEFDFRKFSVLEEMLTRQTKIPPYNEEEGLQFSLNGRSRVITSGRGAAISLRVLPLTNSVYQSIVQKRMVEGSDIELVRIGRATHINGDEVSAENVLDWLLTSVTSVHPNGNVLAETKEVLSGKHICCVVSNSNEVYVDRSNSDQFTNDEARQKYMDLLLSMRNVRLRGDEGNTPSDSSAFDQREMMKSLWEDSMKRSVISGFELAMRSGPFCEEPIRNSLVLVEGVEIAMKEENGIYHPCKPLSGGLLVSAIRTGVRGALLTRPARLMEKHLRLTIHSSLSSLGTLYPVLSKRRARILDDAMVDGTDLILITALIPQAEAFGLAPELYGKTSGEVTAPEMTFSHWDRLDLDPFWIPTSHEEREDFGELQTAGDTSTGLDNTALNYIRRVRKQKGLMVDSSRTVVAAEKQKTLKNK